MTEYEGNATVKTAWSTLKAAAQEPTPGDVTSNTQWSIVYDKTNLTAEVALRRDWNTIYEFELE